MGEMNDPCGMPRGHREEIGGLGIDGRCRAMACQKAFYSLCFDLVSLSFFLSFYMTFSS